MWISCSLSAAPSSICTTFLPPASSTPAPHSFPEGRLRAGGETGGRDQAVYLEEEKSRDPCQYISFLFRFTLFLKYVCAHAYVCVAVCGCKWEYLWNPKENIWSPGAVVFFKNSTPSSLWSHSSRPLLLFCCYGHMIDKRQLKKGNGYFGSQFKGIQSTSNTVAQATRFLVLVRKQN